MVNAGRQLIKRYLSNSQDMLFQEHKGIWLLMSNTKNRISLYPNYYKQLSSGLMDNVVRGDLEQISRDEKRT